MDVVVDGEKLRLGAPLNLRLLYQGDHAFVSADDPDTRITFQMDGERASGFTLQLGDVSLEGTRVN